ncbi:hypothetical protein DSO57_1023824 [Entomophthora muscae]|uniref:Uncharacterized protein n=1 Tax=Entomophthora muscae TaxID=34485 RepID=A0ACC2UN60_9FUNG|nr:hypothetical protein DSO57_1023824 [Entomophthora muscae]
MLKYRFATFLLFLYSLAAQRPAQYYFFCTWGSLAVMHSLMSLPIPNFAGTPGGSLRVRGIGDLLDSLSRLSNPKEADFAAREIHRGEKTKSSHFLCEEDFEYLYCPTFKFLKQYLKEHLKLPSFFRGPLVIEALVAKPTLNCLEHSVKAPSGRGGIYSALHLARENLYQLFSSAVFFQALNSGCTGEVIKHISVIQQSSSAGSKSISNDFHLEAKKTSDNFCWSTRRLFRRDSPPNVEVEPHNGFLSSPGQMKLIFFLSIFILIASSIILALGLFFFYRVRKLQRASLQGCDETQAKANPNETMVLEPKEFPQKSLGSSDFKTLVTPTSSNEEFFLANTLDSETICQHSSSSTVSNTDRQSYFEDEEKMGHLAATVHFRYQPVLADELSLDVGDRVFIQHKFDDGWAIGIHMISRKAGAFPMACLTSSTACVKTHFIRL